MLTTNIHVYIKVKFSIPLISSYLFKNVFCQTKFCELDARVCCRACKMIEIWVGYLELIHKLNYCSKQINLFLANATQGGANNMKSKQSCVI